MVVPNVPGVQTLPQYWGEDSLVWRPSRWILSDYSSQATAEKGESQADLVAILAAETIFEPKTGTYLPWSYGPRACPGKRHSQVEVVAILAALFQSHHVEPVPHAEEDSEGARKRVMDVLDDWELQLTLGLRKSERVALRWQRWSGFSA